MNAVADLGWLAAPAAALVAACALLLPLGRQVLARGVVFIDLAVAQVAALGVLLAAHGLREAPVAVGWLASALAALAGSALVGWLARRWSAQREALIGLVYVAAASACVVAVAADPHGRENLSALLAADVLWVSWGAVLALALAAASVALVGRRIGLARDTVFYPVFAVALSIAVQALGLYLVFALLIGPALWTRRGLTPTRATAAAIGACFLGLGVSWALDWPSAATVALAVSAWGLASLAGRDVQG
ncbi:MAG: hypothetical protein RL522_1422 [Pseudomonadota bacterium]|jgi:zinc/manganese transport system permease protein